MNKKQIKMHIYGCTYGEIDKEKNKRNNNKKRSRKIKDPTVGCQTVNTGKGMTYSKTFSYLLPLTHLS